MILFPLLRYSGQLPNLNFQAKLFRVLHVQFRYASLLRFYSTRIELILLSLTIIVSLSSAQLLNAER